MKHPRKSTPGKLTHEVIARIAESIRQGLTQRDACALERISHSSLSEAVATREDVALEIAAARAEAARRLLDAGDEHSSEGRSTAWQQWRLAKHDPQQYGAEPVVISGGENPLKLGTTVTVVLDENAKRILRERKANK